MQGAERTEERMRGKYHLKDDKGKKVKYHLKYHKGKKVKYHMKYHKGKKAALTRRMMRLRGRREESRGAGRMSRPRRRSWSMGICMNPTGRGVRRVWPAEG